MGKLFRYCSVFAGGFLLLLSFHCNPVAAADIDTSISLLLQRQMQMEGELKIIKNLLLQQKSAREQTTSVPVEKVLAKAPVSAGQTSPTVEKIITLAPDRIMGATTASIVIVEVSDFECYYCRQFAKDTYPQLKAKYVDSGIVKFAFRDLPVASSHPNAALAAAAARCAGEQNKFWQMHDALFSMGDLSPSGITDMAKAIGLNMQDYNQCIASKKYDNVVRTEGRALAKEVPIRTTPTFLIGTIQPDGQSMLVKKVIAGAKPMETFDEAIRFVQENP